MNYNETNGRGQKKNTKYKWNLSVVESLLLFIGSCLWILEKHVGTISVHTDWGKDTLILISPSVTEQFKNDAKL